MVLLSLVAFLLIFSLLIIIHEWGHYIAARKSGIQVEEFAVGFGKKIFAKKYDGVLFRVNLIPFGGYVKMLGEDKAVKKEGSFSAASLPRRMMVTLAGVCMNFISAILVLTLLFSIGNRPFVFSQEDLDQKISEGYFQAIEKDGQVVRYEVLKLQQMNPLRALIFSGEQVFSIGKTIVVKVAQIPVQILLRGEIPPDLVGPIGIAEITHHTVRHGWQRTLELFALLSISLGVMNLMPIPALDGGRFLFQIVEAVFRRPIPHKWESIIHGIGFLILISLMLVISWNDVFRLYTKIFVY